MIIELVSFFIAMILCMIIIYIISFIWFSDNRNQEMRSFFAIGFVVFFWTLFSGCISLCGSNSPHFPVLQTIRMIFVCLLPYTLLWFLLDLTGKDPHKTAKRMRILYIIPFLDAVGFITNPLHHLVYRTYDYPLPTPGPLFYIHSLSAYTVVLLSLVYLFSHLFKNERQNPKLILIGVALLIPLFTDILGTFNVTNYHPGVTSIMFCISFFLFFTFLYYERIFNFRQTILAAVFDKYPSYMLLINKDGIIIDKNGATLDVFAQADFMVTPWKLSVQHFLNTIQAHASHYTPNNLFDRATLFDASFTEGEFTVQYGETAKERTFRVTSQFAYSRKGKILGYALSFSDITYYISMMKEINKQNEKLKELTQLAEAASQAKSVFLANMSHEIRTPLNAVMGMTHIARKALLSGDIEKTRFSIKEISIASEHLMGILNDILDISKIESGKFKLSNEPFLLTEAMEEVRTIFIHRCNEKDTRFISEFDIPPTAAVQGDKLRLKQVLINLLGNAVKFTPSGKGIGFYIKTLEENEQNIRLQWTINDQGIGMNEVQMSRLFKPFEQTNKNIAAHFGGTGLGLAISQNLIKQMGGCISVQSEEGKGSVFTFELTLDKSSHSITEDHIYAAPPNLKEKNILLVEDVEINRIIIREILEETHVTIEEALDGEEAVRKFSKAAEGFYSLIFMDVQMPVMNGYEATRSIRSLDRADAKSIPIIAMTANAYREDVDQALQAGMNGHLAKPIDFNAIMKVLSESITPQAQG
ncbi:MAG: response regulator [Treponema sp.]|jgi:signal transduction histidine kinase/CheY-like chemotaxis protein|nr:response regulator [Treponema sp.]